MNTTIMNESIAVAANPVAKVVTAKDIAEKLGVSVSTVKQYMKKNPPSRGSQKTIELVRQTAAQMGYDPRKVQAEGGAHTANLWKNREVTVTDMQMPENPTMADVARKCGCSLPLVSRALSGKRDGKYAEGIRMIAKEYGYINPRSPEGKALSAKKKEEDYLLTHNFPSREAETKRMEYLREQGYSNKEIARKIGRCVHTIRRRIGSQSEDMTLENRILGQKNVAARNAQRRQYVADHTIREYNGLVTKLDQVNEKIVELNKDVMAITGQIKAMEPKVVEASKVSSVEVKQLDFQPDLMSAAPTMAM